MYLCTSTVVLPHPTTLTTSPIPFTVAATDLSSPSSSSSSHKDAESICIKTLGFGYITITLTIYSNSNKQIKQKSANSILEWVHSIQLYHICSSPNGRMSTQLQIECLHRFSTTMTPLWRLLQALRLLQARVFQASNIWWYYVYWCTGNRAAHECA